MRQPGLPRLVLVVTAALGLAANPQSPPPGGSAPSGPKPQGRLPLSVGPAPAIVALRQPDPTTTQHPQLAESLDFSRAEKGGANRFGSAAQGAGWDARPLGQFFRLRYGFHPSGV